jgi:two-component system cell cycle response regulator
MPGSVFHMILPHTLRVNSDICKKSRDESNTGGNDESKSKLPQQTEAMPAILLIDNNPDTTGIIKKMLHDAFELIIATSAEEALTTGFSSSPECILINEALKGLDAIRLCSIFRTQPETKDTPLGLYSSASDESRIRDAFNVGADEYIVLPLSDRDFVEKIWHLLIKKKESSFFA